MKRWGPQVCRRTEGPPLLRRANVDITLGDLFISSDPKPTGREYFLLETWEGWETGGEMTGGTIDWDNADGGVFGSIWTAGRSITLNGSIIAADLPSLMEQHERLQNVLVNPRTDWLVVSEAKRGLSRMTEVRRTAPPLVERDSDRSSVFTLNLEAADFPRLGVVRRSATIAAGGTNVTNLGNFPAFPTIRLQGPLTQPGLTWDNMGWKYYANVPSGTTLLVDTRRRVVRNPATSGHTRADAGGDWLQLPQGTTNLQRTGTGTGTIRVDWHDTWS